MKSAETVECFRTAQSAFMKNTAYSVWKARLNY